MKEESTSPVEVEVEGGIYGYTGVEARFRQSFFSFSFLEYMLRMHSSPYFHAHHLHTHKKSK